MENPSYHRKAPVVVTDRMRRQIAGAVAEIDMAQMAILRRMTPAERMAQAVATVSALERVASYRLRQRHPELSGEEALRIVRSGLMQYELGRRK